MVWEQDLQLQPDWTLCAIRAKNGQPWSKISCNLVLRHGH